MADALIESIHDCDGIIVEAQVCHSTAPKHCHTVHQEPVGGFADAKAENARCAQLVMQRPEDLLFVSDVAISHEGYQTKSAFIMREIKSRSNAFDHLSSAGAIQRRQVLQTGLNIFRRRENRFGPQL